MISLSKTYWNRYFVGEISRTQKTNNHKDNKKQPHGRKKWWVCFFLCFLEVLFGFWPQVANSLRRPQWSKKYRLGDYLRPNISLESFFFRVFLVFDQKWQNPRENQKKQIEYSNYIKWFNWSHLFHVFQFNNCFNLIYLIYLLFWNDLIYWIQSCDDMVWIFGRLEHLIYLIYLI